LPDAGASGLLSPAPIEEAEMAGAGTAPGHDQIVALLRDWDAAWEARDTDALAGMYTEDAVWEDPTLPAPIRGRAALKHYFAELIRAIPDLSIKQERIFTDPERGAMASQWRLTGTLTNRSEMLTVAPTGDRVDMTGVAVATLEGDKVRHLVQYQDVMTFQRQIGAIPPPGSRGERVLMGLQALGAKRRMRKNRR
jgi:steroid delta-isomerase-like uncharacterized protein